eukprot:5913675-Ditylum_brightwellii.AAC.1
MQVCSPRGMHLGGYSRCGNGNSVGVCHPNGGSSQCCELFRVYFFCLQPTSTSGKKTITGGEECCHLSSA